MKLKWWRAGRNLSRLPGPNFLCWYVEEALESVCQQEGRKLRMAFFFYLSLVFSVRPGLSAGGKATWFLRGTCSCSIVAWFPPMGLPQGTLWKASPAAQVIPQPRRTFLISSPGPSDNLQRSGQSQGFHAAATRHRQRGRSLLLASKRKC